MLWEIFFISVIVILLFILILLWIDRIKLRRLIKNYNEEKDKSRPTGKQSDVFGFGGIAKLENPVSNIGRQRKSKRKRILSSATPIPIGKAQSNNAGTHKRNPTIDSLLKELQTRK